MNFIKAIYFSPGTRGGRRKASVDGMRNGKKGFEYVYASVCLDTPHTEKFDSIPLCTPHTQNNVIMLRYKVKWQLTNQCVDDWGGAGW